MQNILVSGGAGVRENILKRQETYGVAFALILGCALAVMALAGNQQGPDAVCNIGPKEIKDQCWTQQFASGVSVGTSLLIEMVVLANIAFVSTISEPHLGYVVYHYQWMFSLATGFGVPICLSSMIAATGLSISINMQEKETMNYWPSLCVYAFMALTLLIMLVQGWFLHSVKLTIAAHNASKHFPELDFESCGLCGEPIKRSGETVPLKNTETDDTEKNPVSAAGEP